MNWFGLMCELLLINFTLLQKAEFYFSNFPSLLIVKCKRYLQVDKGYIIIMGGMEFYDNSILLNAIIFFEDVI